MTVIGCSGSIPGPDSPASCYLLEVEGFRLLVDLGNGALGPLQRQVSLSGIDAVCLSHLHGDHCLDMTVFYVARTFGPYGTVPRIPVYGPEGTADRMARAQPLAGESGMTQVFDFQTLVPGTRQIGPFVVSLAHMNHPVETFGFRFQHGDRSVAYSADTGETPALVELARDADLLLCEASFLTGPDLPADLHLTARQAAEHAARAGTARLVLTHLPPWNDQERTMDEAAGVPFGGKITCAAAGQSFDLG
jgi:ribonuclease BN (tRNA processing enzyme)